MEALRVGVLGCGSIARSVYLPILTDFPRVEVVAPAEPDARRLAEAARLAPRAARIAERVGFNFRFNPLYQAARRQIASGRLGELVSVRSVLAASARDLPAWKHSRATR